LSGDASACLVVHHEHRLLIKPNGQDSRPLVLRGPGHSRPRS
jgi:hypothetical protein